MSARAISRLLFLTGVLLALAGSAYGQLTITPGPLSDGVVTRAYFTSITSTNSVGAITWSVLSGTFPPGLVLNQGAPNTFISGTATQVGTFTFTIQAVDSQGQVAAQQFSIQINTLLTIFTQPTLHTATAGAIYQTNLVAQGGVPRYFWSLYDDGVSSGVFPPGMTLRDDGLITGAASTPGVYTFVAYVNDNSSTSVQFTSRSFTLTVNPAISIPSTSLPGGVVGVPYSGQLSAKDGNTPYHWAITGGALPSGLSMDSAGAITGVPSVAGTYTFGAIVTDVYSSTASASFVISIAARLAITTTPPLPAGVPGVLYSVQFAATTASLPVTWGVSAGTLPAGLTLDTATGILTGTPTAAGTFSFTIEADDARKDSATRGFTITITAPLAITTATLPDGTVGVVYSQTVAVTGGTKNYAFSILGGSLPAGLTLDPSTGVITGKPTQAGASSFTIQVADATEATASKDLSINIGSGLAFTTDSPLPGATGGSAYSQSIVVTGGTPPYTFTIDSGFVLPGGVTLDPTTGKLAGTPKDLGAFHFVVRVTDAGQATLTKAYDLTVAAPTVPPPTIGGVTDTEPPAEQPTLSLELAHSYPLPLNGTMTLTFQSAAGDVDDPAIQFSSGGRTVNFTVTAGTTTAVFSSAEISLSTGTVAGTITLTLQFQTSGQDVTPQPAPTRVIQIPAQAPVISKVTATHTSTGFEVDVTGFSNSREMVSASFTFQAATGTTLQGTQATITADTLFATWYDSEDSLQFGSQFTFTQPFTISGNLNGVAGVTVTLTNKLGTSNTVTATVQ